MIPFQAATNKATRDGLVKFRVKTTWLDVNERIAGVALARIAVL